MKASSEKYEYSISWSAKSGCTTFRKLFLFLHQNELDNEPTNKWHDLDLDFPFNNRFKKVMVLSRNPYDRVLSAFTNKVCGGPGHNGLSRKISLNRITFKNFLLYLFDRKSNLGKIDVHITPQHFSLNLLEDHEVFKIQLESFNQKIIEAYNYFGLEQLTPDIKIFLANKNEFKNATQRNDDDFFCGETIYSIDETVFPEIKYFYNDELRELVQKIYAEDFKIFNYAF